MTDRRNVSLNQMSVCIAPVTRFEHGIDFFLTRIAHLGFKYSRDKGNFVLRLAIPAHRRKEITQFVNKVNFNCYLMRLLSKQSTFGPTLTHRRKVSVRKVFFFRFTTPQGTTSKVAAAGGARGGGAETLWQRPGNTRREPG